MITISISVLSLLCMCIAHSRRLPRPEINGSTHPRDDLDFPFWTRGKSLNRWWMIRGICQLLLLVVIAIGGGLISLRWLLRQRLRKKRRFSGENVVIGFFHPYWYGSYWSSLLSKANELSNAGGGGEKVLWQAVKATQDRYSSCICVVYTGDTDASPDQIIQNVEVRMSIATKQ